MNKGSAIISIIVAFVGGIAVGQLIANAPGSGGEDASAEIENEGDAAGAAAPADGIQRYQVPVTNQQPSRGPADALVTIVMFSDYQCPFCSRVEPTLNQLLQEYRGKLRIVWRDQPLPFHQNAMPAAQAAREAFAQGGSEKFWRMHDVMFQNQQALARPDLERYAQQIGLDMERFRRALDTNAHQAVIQADSQLGNGIGARGTPTFFINGRQFAGAQPIEQFKQIIDDEVRRAEALVREGTSKARVYAALTRGGLTQEAPAAAPPGQPAQPAQAPAQPDPNAVYKVELQGNEPQQGRNDALITIVEVSDFQCPFCSRVNPTMAQIAQEYGNDVRFVWWNNPLPFHPNAMPAAIAALEAYEQGGNTKFWALHAKLFENQQDLSRATIERLAQEVGLNMTQLRRALDTEEHKATIEAQQRAAAQLGAMGTPSFFINGRNVRGAQPYEAFKAVIDAELAKARQLVASGTPRSRVYQATIANGATAPRTIGGGAAPAGGAPAAPAQPPSERVEIAVPSNAPSKGGRNARVVIQEFSDYQCPFCSRVEPTINQIMETYGDRVRVVWRDYPLPFHQQAMPAHIAGREVFRQGGAQKFWAYHALIFANQQNLTRENLEAWAQQVGGINMTAFRNALDNETHKAAIEADIAAASAAGIRGTPTFTVNGQLVRGAQPFEAFKAAIDAALAAPR